MGIFTHDFISHSLRSSSRAFTRHIGAPQVLTYTLRLLSQPSQARSIIKQHRQGEDTDYDDPTTIELTVLRAATSNFSAENKLGEGGFGEVFKELE
uniref:OSJNBa0061C06.16 protein n=1 Tax=Oryza sativa subsp. japonica TaxID=39947 RepID=Q5JQU9_ORYSJ|nr:OSJNBa0061C06.16 [Oryza sativa Japonica Group]